MADPFVHLHVASGYSLQYGASHPHVLVERAAEQEMDTLALTDRDGTYGAVRFVKAAMAARIRPILGVDLAFAHPDGPVVRDARLALAPQPPGSGLAPRPAAAPPATPACPGSPSWPAGRPGGRRCAGWSRRPTTPVSAAPRCAPPSWSPSTSPGTQVRVLLGPASELGGAATLRRDDLGRAVLRRWLDLVGPEQLVVEVVSHRLPGSGPGLLAACRPDGRAGPTRPGCRTVLSNAVRFADRLDAPTVDVLDAARRLVPMDVRHLDRSNAEGFLKSGKEMHEVAEEICRYAGLTRELPGCHRAARPDPHARRPVRARPAGRPRDRRGALPGVRDQQSPCPAAVPCRCLRGGRGAPGPPGEAWMGLARRDGARRRDAGVQRAEGWLRPRRVPEPRGRHRTGQRRRPRAPRPLRGRDRVALRLCPAPADLEAARRRAADDQRSSASRRTSSPSATSPR